MNLPRTQADRVYLKPQFVIQHRRVAKASWVSESTADYVCLFELGGRMAATAGEVRIDLESGDALLLNPGSVGGATGRASEFLVVTISPSFMLDCAARTKLTGRNATISFSTTHVRNDSRLSQFANEMVNELMSDEAGQDIVIASMMEQLMVHLLRRYANVRREDVLELSRVGLVDRRIRRAIELMHSHLDRELPLEEIASAAYLSPFHFARLFKKLTGVSPHAYLAALRSKQAQTLLAETDLSVSQVGARVGYSSASHFTKAFRQATGLTPRAFRNALIK